MSDIAKPTKPGKPGEQPLAHLLAAQNDPAQSMAAWQSRWSLSHAEAERLVEGVVDILGYLDGEDVTVYRDELTVSQVVVVVKS